MSGTTIDFATFACSSVEIADAFVGEFPAFNVVARNASSAVIEDKNQHVRLTIDDTAFINGNHVLDQGWEWSVSLRRDDADGTEWRPDAEGHCSIVNREYMFDALIEIGELYS